MEEHARYGGVVPEVAARAHLEALGPTIEAALAEAGVTLHELDAIAVTSGPGLAGALMVGVGAAKALAIALEQAAVRGQPPGRARRRRHARRRGALEYPTVALLVSGGHTSLLLVRDLVSDVELLGETIDDAAGEAFDKVARLLGLPYPGGPEIDRAAARGDPTAIRFPRGLTAAEGPREASLRLLLLGAQDRGRPLGRAAPGTPVSRADGGRGRELPGGRRRRAGEARRSRACADLGVPRLLLGGGVMANADCARWPRSGGCRGHRIAHPAARRYAPTTAR